MVDMAALANIGLSMITGAAARTTARAQNKLRQAGADAANVVREGANVQRAAEGSLARWMQGENNRRRLAAAGEQFNAGQQTLVRMQTARARGGLEEQIAAAEQAGAYAASVAFAGTGGSSVDIVDTTLRLRDERAAEARRADAGLADYDALTQIAGIMPQATSGLDLTSFAGGLDLSRNLSGNLPVQGNFLLDFVKGMAQSPDAFAAFQSAPSSQTPTTGDFARADRANYFADTSSSVRLR